MSDSWEYQVRINLDGAGAETARNDPDNPTLKPLTEILDKHRAALKNQFDAFKEYVVEAEKHGVDNFPLYKWTKATIEDPVKEAKHKQSFSLYVDGNEVYPKQIADALEADLRPLVGGPLVSRLTKLDTNPANSPQPPAHLR